MPIEIWRVAWKDTPE